MYGVWSAVDKCACGWEDVCLVYMYVNGCLVFMYVPLGMCMYLRGYGRFRFVCVSFLFSRTVLVCVCVCVCFGGSGVSDGVCVC